ncbi:MAG: hypothetical protein NUV92_08380 [Ignavibacteria bacterium]|jgi:hypothetical protein|nr:hypothetical protein [Ignavibacteria bacterium]MDH7527235.1 hypothetical protein [Ignavibacteria bacterium]
MKKVIFIFFNTLFFVSIVFSQQINNLDRYNLEKKEPALAGVLEAIVPLVGHAYAGDINRGVVPTLISAGGLVLYFISLSSISLTSDFSSSLSTASLGLLIYAGGRIYGIVSAVNTANDFNKELKKKLNLSLVPIKNPKGNLVVGVSLKFDF